jgi:hypothetical protein
MIGELRGGAAILERREHGAVQLLALGRDHPLVDRLPRQGVPELEPVLRARPQELRRQQLPDGFEDPLVVQGHDLQEDGEVEPRPCHRGSLEDANRWARKPLSPHP